MIPLLGDPARFECPNCTSQLELSAPPSKPVLHPCRGLKGLLAPMVAAGTKCKVETVAREDYEGRDIAQRDGEGNVVMAIETTRDDGTDRVVLVPTAVVDREQFAEFVRSTSG